MRAYHTGVAGHEMRLDQTGRDADLCVDKALVQTHDSATGGCADVDMILIVARKVINAIYLRRETKQPVSGVTRRGS